jgi:NitT/TauT family transport system permease protein
MMEAMHEVFTEEPETVDLEPGAEVLAARRRRRIERALSIASPFLLLGIWELCSRTNTIDVRFFPAPSHVFETFGDLLKDGTLGKDIQATVTRMFIGLLMGGIPGTVIGVAMGLSRNVRAVVKPIVAALFPIPKIAVLPLILLIFGLGEESKYISVAIGVIFLMIINTAAAVMQIEDIYLDVGKNFGAGRWKFFWRIAMPGAMPGILTGLQLALTVSLLIAISMEFVAATSGIGYLIWNSWTIFDVRAMYVGLICCAILGLFFQLCLDLLYRFLIPWRPSKHR